jgi:2-keto-myo-inositol isomerase
MADSINRRRFLQRSGLTAGLALGASACGAAPTRSSGVGATEAVRPVARPLRYQGGRSPWPICLDTSTIRPASLQEKVRICAETGWDGIELWEGELNEYEQAGGNLRDLGSQLRDLGLQVPNVVSLWNAFPQTDEEFEANLDTQRRRLRQAGDVGAAHIQAVGMPARPWQEFDLQRAARQYRRYLEIGLSDYNVNPAVMFLQFMPHIQRMGQASAIAIDADHPRAKVVPDTFHLYRGGTGFSGLKHVRGSFVGVFQINDVPADPPREELEDRHRIFPGDGILPLEQALQDLHASGYVGTVSLQVFNEEYWQRDLRGVAREGLEKTVDVVARALAAL